MLVTLANHLQDRLGHEVIIFTLEGGPSRYRVSPRVRVVPLWTYRLSRGPFKLVALPLAAIAFAQAVRAHRPDAAMSLLVRANLVMVASKLFGQPLPAVISERCVSEQYAGWSPSAVIMRILVRAVYPHADRVVAISRGVKDSLVELGLSTTRVDVIYNPQDVTQIESDALAAPRLRSDDFRVISVGRLIPQKDFPTLLRALQLIRQADDRVRLTVLGEGPDEAELKSLAVELGIQGAVDWRGWVPPYPIMAGSDVFVLSSRFEGFANVIVEAMACGLPVVSTDCEAGPSEILAGGTYGLLVPVGDSAALAAAVMRLRKDAHLRESMAESGRERARDFDVSVIAPSYLAALVERPHARIDPSGNVSARS